MGDWLEARSKAWEEHPPAAEGNSQATLQAIAIRMEKLRQFCAQQPGDSEVSGGQLTDGRCVPLQQCERDFAARHARAQEEWESRVRAQSPHPEDREQFKARVLCLMASLAIAVLRRIHQRNAALGSGPLVPPLEPRCGEGVSEAEAAHYALETLAEVLVVMNYPDAAAEVQKHCLGDGLVGLLGEMMAIPREVELLRYGEGYRTLIVRVVANLAYGSQETAAAVMQEPGMLNAILNATKIDAENPGSREWAQFAARNLCGHPGVQEHIRQLRAQRVDSESERFMVRHGIRALFETPGGDGEEGADVRVRLASAAGSAGDESA
eukprot:TRINITY_DN826_c1_g3_i1.p2 TRINITY_DN826_c1_g3~~TRINITY_DN826_c1_g3_i1.p2  ORF type:complete len:350 (+),score=126.84 TRINITY_DN826_c1_g3_i1:82-1050(+)